MTTTAPFEFDEIGYWSELKLEIVEDYGAAYTKAFANQSLKKYYIDAFSGAGLHRSKRTGQYVEGSPARALNIRPPFDHFYFIDMNPNKTAHLAQLCENRTDVDIVTDDATTYLTRTLLPTIFSNSTTGHCACSTPMACTLIGRPYRWRAGRVLSTCS